LRRFRPSRPRSFRGCSRSVSPSRARSLSLSLAQTVYLLTKRTFHFVFKWAQKREFGANEKMLRTMPIFKHMTPKERLRLASALTTEKFTDGQLILKAGDKVGHLYMLRTGEASLTKAVNGADVEVAHKYPGDYFGDEALFGSHASEQNVVARGELVEIAYITRADFVQTVGEPEEVLNRDATALYKLAVGSIPLLAVLDAGVREQLAANLVEETFAQVGRTDGGRR
jgi:cAMP-dependent protein kinase regulator